MVVDKTKSKYRYCMTKIDNKKSLLMMSSCNFCPYMINDSDNHKAKCSVYINTDDGNNTIKDVYGYLYKNTEYNKIEILTNLDIPNWCKLPSNIMDVKKELPLVSIKKGVLYTEQSELKNYTIVSSKMVEFDKVDGCSLVRKEKRTSKRLSDYDKDDYPFWDDNDFAVSENTITNDTPLFNGICSLCGEKKDSVERNSNLGMCNECKEIKDKNKIYKSYINNFRLKRNKKWKDIKFKVVENKTIEDNLVF